ncbi:MAG: 4-hydroxy-tetrahydrodipicolinate synthase [Halanaerobiaceae bacterium]|jgi:4-hydroxy-tetrahydrodipicolinate synthase|nr:4-hydroxy-tetrahydrodipicolinate synthase [Halanaerobiaceae bacterium]
MKIEGVWLPVITPFYENKIDFVSYKGLIDHYIKQGISGIIPLGTTGESPVIEEDEFLELVEKTVEYVNNRVPVMIGVGGNYTRNVVRKLKLLEKYRIDGILSVSPYYNRPDQRGIYEHFRTIAENTDLNIIIYNIPYRTGRNIENETIYRLAEIKNIIGIKDSSGDIKQSMELLINKPEGFSVLTGEDILFYITLVNGGDGGILASSHLFTSDFVDVYKLVIDGEYKKAFEKWKSLYKVIPLLFKEPNPAPLKYCLKKLNLIRSLETRLPILRISNGLASELNGVLESS